MTVRHGGAEGIAQHIVAAQPEGREEHHADHGEAHKSPLAGGEETLFHIFIHVGSSFIMSLHL